MPFDSKKQRRWMHANKPKMAKEWEKESPTKSKPIKAGHRKTVGGRRYKSK